MQETKKEKEEKFSIANHPWIMLVCAIYHSEKKGRRPGIKDIYELLNPLISLDDLKTELKRAIEWSTVGRSLDKRDDDEEYTWVYYCGSDASREIYEKYWLQIEMEKLEAAEIGNPT